MAATLASEKIGIGRALTGIPPSYTTQHTGPYWAVQKVNVFCK